MLFESVAVGRASLPSDVNPAVVTPKARGVPVPRRGVAMLVAASPKEASDLERAHRIVGVFAHVLASLAQDPEIDRPWQTER